MLQLSMASAAWPHKATGQSHRTGTRGCLHPQKSPYFHPGRGHSHSHRHTLGNAVSPPTKSLVPRYSRTVATRGESLLMES